MNLKNRRFGLQPQEKDPRDFTTKNLGMVPSENNGVIEIQLPNFVYDQGQTDMCTAYTIAMYMHIVHGYNSKFIPHDIYAKKGTSGEGGQVNKVLKALRDKGICPDVLYTSEGTTYPECVADYELNKDMSDFLSQIGRITYWVRPEEYGDVAAEMEQGKPTILAIPIYENFVPDSTGHIPKGQGTILGHHMTLGMGCKPGYRKILNTWGPDWGIDGTAWMCEEDINDEIILLDFDTEVGLVQFQIDNHSYYINGVEHQFDAAPTIINDRTMIELNGISKAFNAHLEWFPGARVVWLRK